MLFIERKPSLGTHIPETKLRVHIFFLRVSGITFDHEGKYISSD